MQCPNCKRDLEEQPLRCSCGYDFQTGARYAPPGSETPSAPLPSATPPVPSATGHQAQRPVHTHPPLADRLTRLCAVIIDTVILFLPVLTLLDDPDGMSIAMAIIGWLTIIGFQIYLLSNQGQTIGKFALKIKIVRVSDGRNGGFVTNVLVRQIVNSLIGIVPFYGLVDILFIFREDRRCVHDHLAGTRVVVA